MIHAEQSPWVYSFRGLPSQCCLDRVQGYLQVGTYHERCPRFIIAELQKVASVVNNLPSLICIS